MTCVVLDTMVLASGFTSQAGASARLLERWRQGAYTLVVSEHILQELRRTSGADRYIAPRTMPQEVAATVALLAREAVVTPLTVPVVGVAMQPKDDLVLSTAISGEAAILCTRDKQMLKLRAYQSVTALSPGELLSQLEGEGAA